ncbi:MAG: UDP-N-acetylglucosamine 1-carboxyvinyltransferase [Candidatus Omnitrophota bacterium]|nr:MAG: UDP-N-acetylglucosamine 1-carboxyvinyltransferase [Candidatus Omnitrophota bacterium]
MDKFVIHKSALKGSVKISGSKNAALPIMAATLLTDEECVIRNVPELMDIRTMIKILEVLGKEIKFQKNTLIVRTKRKTSLKREGYVAPYKLVRTMRASFCCLGPLLAKRKKAKVAFPGGCVIGVRPVDLHLKGLRELGAQVVVQKGYCVACAKALRGRHIYLGGAFGSSVLATANIVMAAALAQGLTLIEHAACEPEIESLVLFLRKMGAQVKGEGTPLIKVQGVKALGGAEFEIIPDRVEAGTFVAASLATNSPMLIEGVNPLHLTSVIEAARSIGGECDLKDSAIFVNPGGTKRAINLTTLPYPGFPTDLQAQFMVCLCLAKGISLITEKIYPDRFMHVAEINRMGASIRRNGPYVIIEGRDKLYGAEVMASDLRASAALVIAALAAEGKTEVLRVYHIDRGYDKIEEKLEMLGAKIRREKQ